MSGWQTIKLKELCERVTVGYVGPMAHEYRDSGVPFLRSQNITPFRLDFENLKYIDDKFHERIKKSALRPGDVGIVRTGYPGTACVIPKALPLANCSDLVIVRPGKNLNPHFLCAIFNSTFGRDMVGGNLVGAAQQHFNVTVAKELKLQLPPRKVQDKIAAILSAYDDLIENNRRRIALLEMMAEEIYREWFVRLRFPGHEQAKFEKGVPVGWQTVELGKVCELIKRGITPNYDDSATNLIVNQRCIRDGNVDLGEARTHETRTPNERLLRYGDVLINSTGVGTLGRVAVFAHEDAGITCDTHVTICRGNPKVVDLHFLGLTVRSLEFYFENMAVGSTGQAELSRDLISKTKIRVPRSEIQAAFGSIVAPLWQQKRLLRATLSELTASRDALLPRLISGKLPVDALDIRFPSSMQLE